MNKHLVIMNGPEQRHEIVLSAINKSKKYVDNIYIIQNGVPSGEIPEEILKYTVISKQDFCPFNEVMGEIIKIIPKNDWFLHLDSDEIPNQGLLNFLKDLQKVDNIYNGVQINFVYHEILGDKYNGQSVDSDFSVIRLHKNTEDLYATSYQKVHFGFSKQNLVTYHDSSTESNIRINHHKHMYSWYLSTLSHMLYAIDDNDESFNDIDTVDKQILSNIKSYFGEYVPSKTYQTFDNKELWISIRETATNLQYSKTQYIRQMYMGIEFIINTKDKLCDLYRLPYCPNLCCKYE